MAIERTYAEIRVNLAIAKLCEDINEKLRAQGEKAIPCTEDAVLGRIGILLENDEEDTGRGTKRVSTYLPVGVKQAIFTIITRGEAKAPSVSASYDKDNDMVIATAAVYGADVENPLGRATVYRAVERDAFDRANVQLADDINKAQGSALSNAYSAAYADGGYGRLIAEIAYEVPQAETAPMPDMLAMPTEKKAKPEVTEVPFEPSPDVARKEKAKAAIPAATAEVVPVAVDVVGEADPVEYTGYLPVPSDYPNKDEALDMTCSIQPRFKYSAPTLVKSPSSYVACYSKLKARGMTEADSEEMRGLRVLISERPELLAKCISKGVTDFLAAK